MKTSGTEIGRTHKQCCYDLDVVVRTEFFAFSQENRIKKPFWERFKNVHTFTLRKTREDDKLFALELFVFVFKDNVFRK